MQITPFNDKGSTALRREFWRKVHEAVRTIQKSAGRNVSIDERRGFGTVINVDRKVRAPAPSDCPCLKVVFSGVTFDCGCIDNGDGTSSEITDHAFNDQSPLPMAVAHGNCCGAPNCFSPCAFWTPDGSSVNLDVRSRNWFSNNTCTGTPGSDGNVRVSPIIMRSGGVWYVLAGLVEIGGATLLAMFSGHGPSLGSISNDITTCGVVSITNPIVACLGGGITTVYAVAHGGTATITQSTSCGACHISPSICVQTSSTACAEDGGTYDGDGTHCTS